MKERLVCLVELPLAGRPGEYFPLVRCEKPESVAEVVRVLLAPRDPQLTEVRVTVLKVLE